MSKAIIKAVLSTLYKMDEGEIAESLKDSDLQEESSLDNDIIDIIKTKDKERLQEATKRFKTFGYNDGVRTGLNKLEDDIRAEYGIEDLTLKGLDLVKKTAEKVKTDIETEYTTKGKAKPTEDVRKTAEYLQLEQKLKEIERNFSSEKEAALNALKAEYTTKEIKGKSRSLALETLDALKPILSEDPAKSKRQKDLFLNELDRANIGLSDDGNTLLVYGDNGQPLLDEQGYTIDYATFVKTQAAASFDFAVSTKRDAPGNGGKPTDDTSGSSSPNKRPLPKPKTQDELALLMEDRSYTPDERYQMNKDFQGS
jgi:hypothetical protein